MKHTWTSKISDSPEVEIEQTWRMDFTGTELEIDCIVFANPPAQVTRFEKLRSAIMCL